MGHSLGGILVKQALVNAHANPKHKNIIDSTFALVFMGTPHSGPTNNSKIAFGKVCAKVVEKVYGSATNDLIQAVENGSLFSDILKENWRHQLERYQIISCYETVNEVRSFIYPSLRIAMISGIETKFLKKTVPYDSAILGLPGDRETILRRHAGHSDVCRFNPCDETDEEDFEIFEGNLKRLYRFALKTGEIGRDPSQASDLSF